MTPRPSVDEPIDDTVPGMSSRRPSPSGGRTARSGVLLSVLAWAAGGALIVCDLRTGEGWDVLGLPLSATRSVVPARPGVYERPPQAGGLVAALRRGVIVIQDRPGLPDEVVQELEALQKAVPAGTIVTPQPVRTRYAVAAVGWRAVLGCGRYSRATFDAIRLFRGRYVGSGPDRPV